MIKGFDFHRIKKVTISEPRLYGGANPFSARSIVLINTNDETFEVTVFSNEDSVEFVLPDEMVRQDSFTALSVMG